MIAPHRPPLGCLQTFFASVPGGKDVGLEQLEAAYSEWSGGFGAVWLPSARAGIIWALHIALQSSATVLAPAFTCNSLHDVLLQWPGELDTVDVSGAGFLMDGERLQQFNRRGAGLVLCEPYGHTYDLSAIRSLGSDPAIRILDMAMAVPQRALLQRMGEHDFGVLSFGIGKSMYAGCGGIGFCRNTSFALDIKKMRDRLERKLSSKERLKRAVEINLRTLAHGKWLYGPLRALEKRRTAGSKPARPSASQEPANAPVFSDSAFARLSSSALDRALALKNLQSADRFDAKRRALAERYTKNLMAQPSIILPAPSGNGLSHFTVRLNPGIRNSVKERLYRRAINATTLWEFPCHLDKEAFPNAHRLSAEVLNLPLSVQLNDSDVDYVCDRLIESVTLAGQS